MSTTRITALTNLGDIFDTGLRGKDDHCLTAIGLEGTPTHYTRGAFEAEADAIARGLLARGLPFGARIGIVAGNSARFLFAFFGIMRAGLCAVPMNFRLGPAARAHVFADSETVLAFVDAERAPLIPEGVPTIRMDDDAEWNAARDPGPFTTRAVEPGEFANILYTSGSSGLPKGVPITHGGFLYALRGDSDRAPLPWDNRVLVSAPLYHMNALYWMELSLLCGASVVLLPRFDPRQYLSVAASERCSQMSGVPTMIAMILRETDLLKALDLSGIRAIGMGSAPLTAEMLEEIQAVFPNALLSNGYGTTESGPLAFRPHPDGRPTPWPSMGVASDKVEIRLVGGETADEGTMWIRSPVVTPGYLNLLIKTAEKFHDGWYDTGDVMRRDADGFFYFVGRADDMFNCGGENVYPGDVEATLEAHPDIVQAAVVPVPDRLKAFLPAAFVVLRPGSRLTSDAIKAHSLANGPAYQHPRFVEIVDELPLSGTNKVDKQSLKERAAAFARDQ